MKAGYKYERCIAHKHWMTEDNLYYFWVTRNGKRIQYRRCRACANDYNKVRRRRLRKTIPTTSLGASLRAIPISAWIAEPWA
jgi:hypothetical protein